MRVVVPFTSIARGCEDSLQRFAPDAEMHYVGKSPLDYWRLLADVWADREDFILVEHDNVFDEDALRVLEECPRPWCTAYGQFNLTRFRRELMDRTPRLFERLPMSNRHWAVLDVFALQQMRAKGGAVCNHRDELATRPCNETRSVTGQARVDEWSAWLRTLPTDGTDEHIRQAWSKIGRRPDGSDDGKPCGRHGCKRAAGPATFLTCSRCEGEPTTRPILDGGTGLLVDEIGRLWTSRVRETV